MNATDDRIYAIITHNIGTDALISCKSKIITNKNNIDITCNMIAIIIFAFGMNVLFVNNNMPNIKFNGLHHNML